MSDRNQALDKIDLHHRQQLSALIDGALAPDEARFLLRRMQHDHDLAECWERWQLAGEILRGRATAVLPTGFTLRVRNAIDADSAATRPDTSAQPRSRWTRNAALAASVAVVAVLVLGPAPDADTEKQRKSTIVAALPAAAVESPAPVPAAEQTRIASATTSTAVVDAPRRVAQRARPVQRARTVARPPAESIDAARVEIALAPAMSTPSPPFAAGTLPGARPWPRAVLPQFGAGGALTADTDASTVPSFYPFEPRLPENVAQPDAPTATPR